MKYGLMRGRATGLSHPDTSAGEEKCPQFGDNPIALVGGVQAVDYDGKPRWFPLSSFDMSTLPIIVN
ncbi:hypothetical protein [Qipengyuania sp. Mu-71]|jgi:hypothetical protein|uniref:hypothetical protein n=1 Tax=Qipengyuania sp. Mu-71 TaxID=3121477 RepID=UPI002FE44152